MDSTNNVIDKLTIGCGCWGTDYRVELNTRETIVVKKISIKKDCALSRSFIAEFKTVGSIRHSGGETDRLLHE